MVMAATDAEAYGSDWCRCIEGQLSADSWIVTAEDVKGDGNQVRSDDGTGSGTLTLASPACIEPVAGMLFQAVLNELAYQIVRLSEPPNSHDLAR